MELKTRPLYLDQLLAAKDNGLIKVITGMRRCGKSSLLALLRQQLTESGIAPDHVIAINLESFQYSTYDSAHLYRHITDRMQAAGHYYLLWTRCSLSTDGSVQSMHCASTKTWISI